MKMKQVVLDGSHDTRELRNALGRFPTGVTVITTRTQSGKLEGLTANSFSALSLDPPLVLWSISRKSMSVPGFIEAGHFAINVLRSGQSAISHHFAINVLRAAQTELSHRFATPRENKFENLPIRAGLHGVPLLDGVLASFECQTETTIEGGDHLLFVGRVHRIGYGDGEPLIFNAGQYATALPLRKPSAQSDVDGVWDGLG